MTKVQSKQQNELYTNSCTTSSSTASSQTPPPTQQALIRDYWYELKFSDLFKFINPDGRYQCPRFNCLKSYKDASSLQRHIRYECGGQKKFRCLMCGKAFSQSSHLKRHLESGVCVKYYL
ncbi:unnamed protein product [Ceratitis capitata]|uniref:(Mediterranean fruit fly) hypothetical protein n=1 Tax=Ceratitis capitata TaxID=7213 RepID=A0A811VI79_CERCA|nr:unnamed protein product [Ceratitis capitata]